jgi:hypothetical protein
MTRVRRLLAVAALLAVSAVLTSSRSWGDPGDRKDRARLLPDAAARPAAAAAPADAEAALALAKFARGGVVTYQTTDGDTLFAAQVKPALEPVKPRPRDYLIMICTSASQAGAPWFAARQIAEAVAKEAGDNDRVTVWTVNEPANTRNLTGDFAVPSQHAKKFAEAFELFKKKLFPAGDTDLKTGLKNAIQSFKNEPGRQQILLYLGDGMSTHNPINGVDRAALCKDMVDRKITFFSVPLGTQFKPENLHGLATGTGGLVVRVKVLEEKLGDAMKLLNAAFAAPVLYPTSFELPGAIEHYPSRLPPLRPDAPTLVIGRMKQAKTLTYKVEGIVDGRPEPVTYGPRTEDVPEAELDNYFLVSMVNQWKNAREQHALIRADRALVFAYEQNRLQHQELLLSAELALKNKELDAAARLYENAKTLVPHDTAAAAGLRVVANLRDGKLTWETLKQQLEKQDRQVIRVEKGGKTVRVKRDAIVQLAEPDNNNKAPNPPGANVPALEREDLLQAHRDHVIIEEQRTTTTVEQNLRQARKILPTEPDEARELLRNTLLRVSDHPDISEKVRSELVNRLQTELRNVELQGAAIKLRAEEQRRLKERVAAEILRRQQIQAEEDRIEGQFRVYKSLMARARFEETTMREVLTGLTALKRDAEIKGLDVPVAINSAYFQTAIGYNLQQMVELRRRKEAGFMATMMSVERSAVPFSDEPPVYFPPLATWKAITSTRKDKYESLSLPDDPIARAEAMRIYKMLDQPIETKDFQAPNMTLKEFLGLLDDKLTSKGMEVPILIDFEAFKEATPDAYKEESDLYDVKVKIPAVPKRLALAVVLRIALSKLPTNDATYLIRRNFIEVTTVTRQTNEKVLRVYPVADLVLPISPFGPNSTIVGGNGGFQGGVGGFGGGFNGGFAALGGIGGVAGIGGGFNGIGGIGGFNAVGGIGGIGGIGGVGGFNALGGVGGFNALGGVGGFNALGGVGGFNALGGVGGFNALGGVGGFNALGGAGGLALGGIGGLLGGGANQNCLGFNLGGFNGNLGAQGSTQDQLLIALIRQTVAPGEWGAQTCQNPLLAQAFGMAGGPAPINTPESLSQTNTLGFYPPALALVVRGTSRIHTKLTGGILGGVKRAEAAAAAAGERANPGDVRVAGDNPRKKITGAIGEAEDEPSTEPKKKPSEKTSKAPRPGQRCPLCGKVHDTSDFDPRTVWQAALEWGVSDPGLILATADFLADHRKFHDAAEFLKANLRMGICVRPWVYEALAIALEASDGSPEDIRRARLSAVALNPQDAQGFLNGARALAEARQWNRALAFCRQAAQLEPNLPAPYADALAYAELAKDSQAMEWAVGNLLRRDWPMDNRELHLKAQRKLEALAEVLENEGRKAEGQRMRTTLARLQERDLVIRLTWQDGTGPADLELEVKEPIGAVCSSQQRQTPGGGTLLGNNLSERNSVRYVAAEAFPGTYELTVRRLWGQPLGSRALLEVIQGQGTPQETHRVFSVAADSKQTIKLHVPSGRRTSLAAVPPPGAQQQAKEAAEERTPGGIMAKLRDVADPDFSEYQKTHGGVGTAGGGWTPNDEPAVRQGPEQLAYQAAVAPLSGSGVDLTARAIISSDQRSVRLSLTPVFQTAARSTGPVVNLPIIPGGPE